MPYFFRITIFSLNVIQTVLSTPCRYRYVLLSFGGNSHERHGRVTSGIVIAYENNGSACYLSFLRAYITAHGVIP